MFLQLFDLCPDVWTEKPERVMKSKTKKSEESFYLIL